MRIYLPHIDYEVVVKHRTSYKTAHSGIWLCERTDVDSSTLFIEIPKKPHEYGMLAHEVMHVIENICIDRGMVLEEEKESMAYCVQYIMNTITCGQYVLDP